MQRSNDLPSRLARLMFTVMMALAWSGYLDHLPANSAAAAEPGHPHVPPATRPATAEDLKQRADEMERGFAALDAASKEIPRDTFDPQAIVDKVGKDPVKLFEWVRDNTFWVPYRGCLRGAKGVLMDRLGSSCDRAVLLAELLRVAGHGVRLARAELTEEQARTLLQKIRAVPKEPLSPAPDKRGQDALIETYANTYKLDPAKLRLNMERSSVHAARLAEEVVGRVAEQTPRLLAAIGKPAAAREQAEKAAADQLNAVRDHWFVQTNDDRTFDPLLPDSAAGTALAAAKSHVPFDPKAGRFVLDSADYHELKISVVIEQWTPKDRLKEKTVLSQRIRPCDVIGERIVLRHISMTWPKELDLHAEADPLAKLKSTVLAQDEWLPVLSVGPVVTMESSFTRSGHTDASATDRLNSVLDGKGLGTSVGGILGSGRIGRPGSTAREPAGDGQLTAEWIDYEVRSPGQNATTIRRQTFDLMGPAARKAGTPPPKLDDARLELGMTLLGETEILPLVCQLSREYVAHLWTRNALANARILLQSLRAPDAASRKTSLTDLANLRPLPSSLYTFALMRNHSSRSAGQTYLDGLNIVSYHEYTRQTPAGELRSCWAFDIVANDVAVHAGRAADFFSAKLEQGVRDTNVEAMLVSHCSPVDNTAELYAKAGAQGSDWVTIRNVAELDSKGLRLPADARARIQDDLAAGYSILVPREAAASEGFIGWWKVHSVTGQTLGTDQRGWGAASVETIKQVAAVTVATLLIVRGFICMANVQNRAGTTGGGRYVGDEQWGEYLACLYGHAAGVASVVGVFGAPIAGAILAVVGAIILTALAIHQLFDPVRRE